MSEKNNPQTARPMFKDAVQRLAQRVGADAAWLGDFVEHPVPRVRTLACYRPDQEQGNFSYPLAGYPCARVRLDGRLLIADGLVEQFPEAAFLLDRDVRGYAGIRLDLTPDAPFGLLVVLFRQPLADPAAVAAAMTEAAALLCKDTDRLERELERERLHEANRYRDELDGEYVLDNPEGLSLSMFMPPVPIDLPMTELVDRMIRTGYVVQCNKAIARMYGYPDHRDMIGARPMDVQGEERAQRMVRMWAESNYRLIDHESQTVDADGNVSWVLSTAVAQVEDGKLTHFWTKRRDITDQKRYQAAIQHKAHHDALTGLSNRYWFQDRLAELLDEHAENGKAFALMLLDLNRFKEVNDTLGHMVGDELLRAVAKRLLIAVRPMNADIARLGGDEFAVLVPDLRDSAQADRVAQAVLDLLSEPFPIDDMHLQIGGSIGVCAHPGFGNNPDDLMRYADIAMYTAKNDARGYCWYQPEMDRYSKLRLTLLADLGPAIEQNQLFLEYQPKIALDTGQACGFEVLLRWKHPLHGLIPPANFIPLAETSDVIQPLTRWVIRAAIEEASRWRTLHASPLRVAVNLSARNLLDDGLLNFLAEVLAENDFPASLLELEITESVAMSRPDHSLQLLRKLADMGLTLAIDDFGTGYSSLAYLARMPVSTLKIDQSFVRAMATSRADTLIVRSVIGLANQMGLEVVAEGVEDETALQAIAAMGCQFAQGYHIARPLPASALPQWLREREQLAVGHVVSA